MIAHIYDEISGDWTAVVIRDLERHVGQKNTVAAKVEVNRVYWDIEEQIHPGGGGTNWGYVGHSRTGPILTIYSRSERGHDGITVINFNEKS